MLRRSFLLLCALSFCAASAQAQVKFEFKMRENSTTTSETTTKIEQNLKIAGMNQDSAIETRRKVKGTSGKRDGLGRLRVEEKPEEFYISINVGGAEYIFDSKNPDAKGTSPQEAARPIHKAISQQSMVFVHDKDNSLEEVEFDQQFLNTLDAAVQQQVKGQLNPESIKKQVKEHASQIPTNPVSKGDVWEHTSSVNLGAGQVMTFNSKYKYVGTEEKDGKTLDKITYEVTSVSFALEDSPLPLQVKGSNLKADKSGGVLYFDREQGNLAEESGKLHIVGTIAFEVNNNPLPAELDLTIESKVIRSK
ncbi:MAG: DUF6263 family protein [Planctomycetota bacterium]|nr:DUF6263 family protein [Planctomycetota bacterium]